MAAMRLFQIPFSHNCVKVRRVLDLKGIEYKTVDINPAIRVPVRRASGQMLVPALLDGERSISGSTNILLYIEERHPEPSLLPDDPQERAECLVLMEWADAAFMELTRRLAYSNVLAGAADLGTLFFPQLAAPQRRVAGKGAALVLRVRFRISGRSDRRDVPAAKQAARLALERIGGEHHLVGDRLSLADITLAAMAGPLQYATPAVVDDPAVQELIEWSRPILGPDADAIGARAASAGTPEPSGSPV